MAPRPFGIELQGQMWRCAHSTAAKDQVSKLAALGLDFEPYRVV